MIDETIPTEFPNAGGYLNTASLGLPPQRTVDALSAAISDWQAGRARADGYDANVAASREAFAALVDAPIGSVVVGSQVSALVGLAVTALEPGSHILCPEGEFTSVTWPFLVRDDLDLTVETVPLDRLADSIAPSIDLVAFSVVQSADGEVADLAAIKEAANTHGALTLADATQAAGWLPIDATNFDIVIAGTYKWLLCPRGTAFMTMSPAMIERTTPLYAGWYAGEDPWESIYGLPLRLASNARRFDLSPGWLAWVGTESSLRLLNDIGVDAIYAHNVGLANALLSDLELPPTDSAIISLELATDLDERRLDGLATAYRAGRLRVGFHLYNTMEDVARVVAAVRG